MSRMLSLRVWSVYWLSILSLFGLDRWSKILAERYLVLYESVSVMPGLNIMLTYNSGSAYGFLANQPGWQRWFLISIAIVMIGILSHWLWKVSIEDTENKKTSLNAISLIFLLAGALGNLWDRLSTGWVVDYIDFYIKNWHFATFNIADAWITLGVLGLIWSMLFTTSKPE